MLYLSDGEASCWRQKSAADYMKTEGNEFLSGDIRISAWKKMKAKEKNRAHGANEIQQSTKVS